MTYNEFPEYLPPHDVEGDVDDYGLSRDGRISGDQNSIDSGIVFAWRSNDNRRGMRHHLQILRGAKARPNTGWRTAASMRAGPVTHH